MLDFVFIIACYLLGAVPFGLLFGLGLQGVDIRRYGSGNLGATNAARVLGKKLGLLILVLDFLKGFAPVFCLSLWYTEPLRFSVPVLLVLVGAASIAGHIFPVYLKFKGGKGMATSMGVVMALLPIAGLAALGLFVVVVLLTRYISLASMMGAVVVPVVTVFQGKDLPYIIFTFAVLAFVLFKHRPNIQRLLAGTESKFASGRKELDELQISKSDLS